MGNWRGEGGEGGITIGRGGGDEEEERKRNRKRRERNREIRRGGSEEEGGIGRSYTRTGREGGRERSVEIEERGMEEMEE